MPRKCCIVMNYETPEEFYIKILDNKESIDLPLYKEEPVKRSDICKNRFYAVATLDKFVLCKILDDIKDDEKFAKIIIVNNGVTLSMDIQCIFKINSSLLLSGPFVTPVKQVDVDIQNTMQTKEDFIYKAFEFEYVTEYSDPTDGFYIVKLYDMVKGTPIFKVLPSEEPRSYTRKTNVYNLYMNQNYAAEFSITRPIYQTPPRAGNENTLPMQQISASTSELATPDTEASSSRDNSLSPPEPTQVRSNLNVFAAPFVPSIYRLPQPSTSTIQPTVAIQILLPINLVADPQKPGLPMFIQVQQVPILPNNVRVVAANWIIPHMRYANGPHYY